MACACCAKPVPDDIIAYAPEATTKDATTTETEVAKQPSQVTTVNSFMTETSLDEDSIEITPTIASEHNANAVRIEDDRVQPVKPLIRQSTSSLGRAADGVAATVVALRVARFSVRSPSSRIFQRGNTVTSIPALEEESSYVSREASVAPTNGPRIGPPPVSLEWTDAQKEAIARCRAAYLEAGGTLDELGDVFLFRYLLTHRFNEKDTIKHLVKTAAWRNTVAVNWITPNELRRRLKEGECKLADAHPKMIALLSCVNTMPLHSATRAGDLVKLGDVGGIDVKRFLADLSDDEFIGCNLAVLEAETLHADQESIKRKTLVRLANITSGAGLAMKHLGLMSRLKKGAPIPDLYYPEYLHCTVITHAPGVAKMAWGAVKGLLSKDVQERVYILGGSQESAAALNVLCSRATLPSCLGGSKEVWSAKYRKRLGFTEESAASVSEGATRGGGLFAAYMSV